MNIHTVKQELDIKTFNSQQSAIDTFSKIEAIFLQNFFRYNLSDYFSEVMMNLFQDIVKKQVTNKFLKRLSIATFRVVKSFIVEEFEIKINSFYKSKSKSIESKEFPCAFKKCYCNRYPAPNFIQVGELIYFEVKVKIQVEKIEELPKIVIDNIENNLNENAKRIKPDDKKFMEMLSKYNKEYFNIFIVYFGDINFQIFNKSQYKVQVIKLFGRSFKLRLYVFYISKQAMVETFRSINKIANLEYINDLVIQFYQMKREKIKLKKTKYKKSLNLSTNKLLMKTLLAISTVSFLGLGGFLCYQILKIVTK